ncbi:MAG: CapA family protein [Chloroflexi bacterium]|nr:CapA family protein [Chloroflexota bacterium]
MIVQSAPGSAMAGSPGRITLIAGGDVGPIIEPVDRLADLVLPVLRQADFRLAQCERTYSERGAWQEWMTLPRGNMTRQPASKGSIFAKAGIDVISVASNHCLDFGYDPLFDTIDYFRGQGIQVIGGGRNSEEARRPAILEKDGVRVAILGYASVIRDGQAAGPGKPGLAPMRASTSFTTMDFQPGSPPKITTVPYEPDMAAIRGDIEKARAHADSVVVFIHWGICYLPKTIATYQPLMAHAAIDAGADLIIGHHAHLPKGIEVYKGKVCFYGVGNFLTTGVSDLGAEVRWDLIWYHRDPDSIYHFPIQCKEAILPKVVFNRQGVERVAFLPVYINKLAQPEPLRAGDPRFEALLNTLEWSSDIMPHKFRVDGDEVVVET